MNESVSVIIPVYNGEAYLAEAIISILNQTVSVASILVIDDGSTDHTSIIARSFDRLVNYIYQPNQGAAAARNRGVASATGEFIAFLDADDLWLPDKLAQQIAALQADPQLDMIFSYIQHFYSPDLDSVICQQIYCPPEAVPGYLPSTLLIRRASWDKVGQLETKWQVGEFIHWYLQAQDIGLRDQMLPIPLAKRRLHRTNQGILKQSDRSDYLRIVKTALNRKRQQA